MTRPTSLPISAAFNTVKAGEHFRQTKGTILEQIVLAINFVELGGDVRAPHTRSDELEPAPVHLAVDLPERDLTWTRGIES
jgi:hypothetical protein